MTKHPPELSDTYSSTMQQQYLDDQLHLDSTLQTRADRQAYLGPS